MQGLLKGMSYLAVVLGVVFGVLYWTTFDFWRPPSDDPRLTASILPNLAPGDLLVVSRSNTVAAPQLVRCVDPDAPGRFVIGRIIGEPGDDVAFEGDRPRVTGRRMATPRGCAEPKRTMVDPDLGAELELICRVEESGGSQYEILEFPSAPPRPAKTHLDPGKVFLASDNRSLHLDSRDFGPVPRTSCQRILLRLWSAEGYGDAEHRFTFFL